MPWGERIRAWADRRRHEILLVWLGTLLLFSHPADGFLRGDGLHYAAVMRSMLDSGDWMTLRFGDRLYFNKPPLFFWFGAAFFSVFGATTLTARIVGTLPALALLLAVYHLVKRLTDARRAFLAGVVLATSSVFVRNSGVPRLEAAQALCHVLALAAVVAGRERPRTLALFWVAVGAGTMVKGPGGLLPAGIVGVWALLRGRAYPFDRRWFWAGLPLLPLVLAPWLAHHWVVHGDRFLHEYFGVDLAESIEGVGATTSPLAKYGRDLALEWWPWIPFMVHGAWRAVRRLRDGPETEARTLAVAWCAVVGLSVLPIARPFSRYLYPALPAAAILAADSLVALSAGWLDRWAERGLRALLAVATLAVAFGPLRVHSSEVPDAVRFLPYLERAGADRPIVVLGHVVPRRFEAGAIFHAEREIELVGPEELLFASGITAKGPPAGGDRPALLCIPRDEEKRAVHDGLDVSVVLEGDEVDLAEVRPLRSRR